VKYTHTKMNRMKVVARKLVHSCVGIYFFLYYYFVKRFLPDWQFDIASWLCRYDKICDFFTEYRCKLQCAGHGTDRIRSRAIKSNPSRVSQVGDAMMAEKAPIMALFGEPRVPAVLPQSKWVRQLVDSRKPKMRYRESITPQQCPPFPEWHSKRIIFDEPGASVSLIDSSGANQMRPIEIPWMISLSPAVKQSERKRSPAH